MRSNVAPRIMRDSEFTVPVLVSFTLPLPATETSSSMSERPKSRINRLSDWSTKFHFAAFWGLTFQYGVVQLAQRIGRLGFCPGFTLGYHLW